MYISSIELNNYRNFRSNIIEFNKGINVIIGSNNSGKSNLLRAMALIFNPSEKRIYLLMILIRLFHLKN